MTGSSMLLAIDTSGRYAGVALLDAGGVVAERTWLSRQSHTVSLLPEVQQIVRSAGVALAQVGAFAVAVGPGAFTGLRVGIGTAKALAWSLGVPCLGVGSLDALAFGHACRHGDLCAATEAGRGDWYVATYVVDPEGSNRVRGPELVTPRDLGGWVTPGTLCCTESSASAARLLAAHPGAAVAANAAGTVPRAAYLARLAWERWQSGEADEPGDLQPVYIRRPAAEERLTTP